MSEKHVEKRGYQPTPGGKPLTGGYQPSGKSLGKIVTPPPPRNNKK